MTDEQYALEFLQYYGYPLGAAGLREFQQNHGLYISGLADSHTVQLMHTPRCGVTDAQRLAEYARWHGYELTYWVEAYVTGQLSHDEQEDLIKQGHEAWGDVSPLRFIRVDTREQANLVYSTGRGQAAGFDGPGGTLAWAQLPPGNIFKGQLLMRFDLDTLWTASLYMAVAAHEQGHLFGLDHSRQRTALMYPYANEKIYKPQPNDDIPRIQALYGKPTAPVPPAPPPSPPSPTPGGFMSRELVTIIVKLAVGAFASYAAGTTKGLMGLLDDYAAKWLQANEAMLVDLIMARFAGKATISEADVALALADIKAEALKAAV